MSKRPLLAHSLIPLALTLILAGMPPCPCLAEPKSPAPNTRVDSSAATAPKSKTDSKSTSVDCYRLWQSTELWGESTVTISALSIRVENPRTGVNMIVSKPFDTVTMFNTQTKSIIQSPVKTFRCPIAKTFALFTAFHVEDVPMSPAGAQTIQGIPAKKYMSSKAFAARQVRMKETDNIPGSNPQKLEEINTDFFNLPIAANTTLSRYYNLPIVPGVPLWANLENLNKGHTTTLKTIKVSKQKIDSNFFALPSGFKTAKNSAEIIRSDMSPESMQLF